MPLLTPTRKKANKTLEQTNRNIKWLKDNSYLPLPIGLKEKADQFHYDVDDEDEKTTEEDAGRPIRHRRRRRRTAQRAVGIARSGGAAE